MNPTEGSKNDVSVRTSEDLVDVKDSSAVIIHARIELTDVTDDRGSKETLIAIGVEGKESVTFFMDNNGNGVRDLLERDLCTVVADANDTATCDIVIQNPPFFPGKFGTGGTCDQDPITKLVKDCNFINFVDSENRTSNNPDPINQATIDRQTFELEGSVNVAPKVVNTGDRVTISLFDFPGGAPVDRIRISRLNVTPATGLPTISTSGEESFTFTIPGIAPACIPTGTGGLSSGATLLFSIGVLTSPIIVSTVQFVDGDVLIIGKERMLVTSGGTTATLTVTRGIDTTSDLKTAEKEHDAGDSIKLAVDLCRVVADADSTATCTFTISNPPFVPGKNKDLDSGTLVSGGGIPADEVTLIVDNATVFKPGQSIIVLVATTTPGNQTLVISSCDVALSGLCTGTVLTLTDGPVGGGIADNASITIKGDCGFTTMSVNFQGSEGDTTSGETAAELDQAAVNRQTFELDQTITASPSTANVGDTIVVSLFDWPTGSISKITLGGVVIERPSPVPTTSASGEVSFDLTIPGVGSGVDAGVRIPTGKIPLKVFIGTSDEDTNITIAGANLSLSHSTVLANQDLTITGSGFSEGKDICILQGKITIGNVPVEFDDEDDCPSLNNVSRDGILLTSGGTFTLTVRVHDVVGSSPALSTALLTEGTHELKVIDTNGAEGTLNVEIAARSLEITPSAARPRDTVTIIGRAFIADNGDGLSTTVNV